MKHFLRLIDTVRNRGLTVINAEKGYYQISTPSNEFWKAIEECSSFVFSDQETVVIKIPIKKGVESNLILDLPFKFCSFELLNNPLLSISDDSNNTVGSYCIFVIENHTGDYSYFSLGSGLNYDSLNLVTELDASIAYHIVKKLLLRLSLEKTGVESVRKRINIGSGPDKRIHTIRRIVHVMPKKAADALVGDSRKIDWTHRWSVRGHWRSVNGLGKDRNGNYCVYGSTWVSDFVKGPDHVPFVSKTRLVKEKSL